MPHIKTSDILAYRKRLESESVFYNSIAEYPKEYFNILASAINESGLESLRNLSINVIQCKKLGDREREIAEFIIKSGGIITSIDNNKVKINGESIPAGTQITIDYFENGKI